MAVKLKDKAEIEKMRQAGSIVFRVLQCLREAVRPGVSTAELAAIADQRIQELGAQALFKGVPNPRAGFPFPASICTSIDHEVVHGIPREDRKLSEGQVVSIDCGVRYDGYCGDSAVTIPVGKISAKLQRLLDVTDEALAIAIEHTGPGKKWSAVAAKMQAHVEKAGFAVVTSFVGHGIGRQMHEEPKIPNFVSRELLDNDILLEQGMVLAVEPMVNMGGADVAHERDGWTVVTKDRLPSAHFEHTVAVTATGSDVLTDGRQSQ